MDEPLFSKKDIEEVLGDYERAAWLIDEAADRLEQASLTVSRAGFFYTMNSNRLVDGANNLSASISRMRGRLKDFHPSHGKE